MRSQRIGQGFDGDGYGSRAGFRFRGAAEFADAEDSKSASA